MKVANMILEQLGGQKFLAMTGANHLVADGNTLRMTLPKNASKANRLYITLDATDTYTMHFSSTPPGTLTRKLSPGLKTKRLKFGQPAAFSVTACRPSSQK